MNVRVLSSAMKKRVSCRTYSEKPIEKDIRRKLDSIITASHEGPFGHKPRFKVLTVETVSPDQWKKMGTYGVIKGARYFLAGMITPGTLAMEDYGYCKEIIILRATELGLGTCWLGGTFQTGFFAQAAGLQAGELLPTVTPLGYPASQKSFIDKLMRRSAKTLERYFLYRQFFPTLA